MKYSCHYAEPRRAAFTVTETVIALGVLMIAAILVAQLSTQSLAERVRADERLAAIESVANLLEAARSRAWAELTPEWAKAQRLPDELAGRLQQPKLTVRVEPESGRERVKRVTVELHWQHRDGAQARGVTTLGLFADRSTGGAS